MKVLLDTNVYIGWIRERAHHHLMIDGKTIKYLSGIVLMELWAGARTRKAARIIEKLQSPYRKAGRILGLGPADFITAGQMISDMPKNLKNKMETASFLDDILISIGAVSIGATVYTENGEDFHLIQKYLPKLKFIPL